ncbi:DUF2298 domain-containing protein [Halodesulfurarchaeum formicicum]|uniref:YYY membrane protein n=1 Tax=Halodesulfurarchaeum formicicum TaxID=1873524 RepID=A0A1J1ACL6_9EURY|nr:DUF2298 domain-containing protein [Halodesulfurarchaeum formicicum]APE95504.1 hypothetical protein HSR6_1053 [Halodesulfurarchaeum formicicum]
MELGIVLTWLVLYLGLGVLALPLASQLFEDFPDRGAGLAIPVAFAVIAVSTYWLGQVRFGLVTALFAVLALLTGSVLALRSGVSIDRSRFRDAAVVFTLAYLLLILIRLYRPGAVPGGGEKFLDFGLLASVLRATALPPQDMWFAGESVQYYYGGHMLAAVFALLTDTAPRFAYNTALAGYYAAYVTAAWGLAGAITAHRGGSYRLGGGIAAFLVGLASNLSTPIRFLGWVLPEPLGRRLVEGVGLEFAGLARGPFEFNYWFASRVIDAGREPGEWELITEFPFFAFLNGDLHGHMMSPVFLLLGAGLAAAYWMRPAADRRGRLGRLLLGAPVGGLLVLTNTWSAPAVFGVAWLTVLFAPAAPWTLLPDGWAERIGTWTDTSRLRTESARLGLALAIASLLAVGGALTVFPFLTGAASGRSVGLLPTPRSDLGGLLTVYGVFLALTASYLASRVRRRIWVVAFLTSLVLLLVSTLVRASAVALFGPLLLGGWYLLRTREAGFETVLAVGALGLVLLVEFVYVIEQAGPGRMNTVFKIAAQVWALWSVAAGVMLTRLVGSAGPLAWIRGTVRGVRDRFRSWLARGEQTANRKAASPGTNEGRHRLASIGLVMLLLALSIYPAFGLAWAVGGGTDDPTLDAHAYIEAEHPEEAAAIHWLRDQPGQPTMVSAPGTEIYRWVNAPSSMTGIPTVAGWSHEVGYRGEEPYWDRVRDVRIIYETSEPESRAALLGLYDVTYIYVGPTERERFGTVDYGEESGIHTAYTDPNVTIYRVDLDAIKQPVPQPAS